MNVHNEMLKGISKQIALDYQNFGTMNWCTTALKYKDFFYNRLEFQNYLKEMIMNVKRRKFIREKEK